MKKILFFMTLLLLGAGMSFAQNVAKNANTGVEYATLQAAIDAATLGDSIVVLNDLSLTATIAIDKSLTINGNKHVITTTSNRGVWFDVEDVTLKLKNFYLDGTNMTENNGRRGIQVDQNNVTLIMDSCRVYNMKQYAIYPFLGKENVNVTVKNSYIQGLSVMRSYVSNSEFIFENDTLLSVNPYDCTPPSSNNFATLWLDGNNDPSNSHDVSLTITNCVIISKIVNNCESQWLAFYFGAANNVVTVDANTKIIDGDENNVTYEMNMWFGGANNYVIMPLSSQQIDSLKKIDYTVTDNGDGTYTISAPAFWNWPGTKTIGELEFEAMYIDFCAPFKHGWIESGDTLTLYDDITLKEGIVFPSDIKFTLNLNGNTIDKGTYCVKLVEGDTIITDEQATIFCSEVGDVTETDNGNGTWTYSVTPYFVVSYDANDGTGIFDTQTKAKDNTITLFDGTALSKTDSTLYRWNTAADEGGVNYALGAEYSDNANLDLFAVWRLNLDMTMDSTDVVCYGENNGTDTVKIIGGEAPFQLVLSSTVLAENDTIKNLMGRTYIYENLKPGSYTVTLTDVLGKDTIEGTFTITEPDTLEITALTVPDKPCPLMGSGTYEVSVTAQGGNTGGYTYTWGNAAVNVNANATTIVSGTDDRDSTYTVSVTVTDSKACTATDTTTFKVNLVIADDGTVHSNTKMTIDTIRQGVMQGCDTIIRDFGTPKFTFTNNAITENILDTIYNDIPVNFPDSIFPIDTSKIIWTAVDTCGHTVTGEQVIILYYYPCPDAKDKENNIYPSVRLGCTCWMAENLKSTKYSDNRDIENVMSYVSPEYPDETANVNTYGHLYDWYAAVDTNKNSMASIEAKNAAGKRVQGVCPEGWYLPSKADMEDMNKYDTKELKSTTLWIRGGGTNATGFNAVPSGFYNCSTDRYENLTGQSYYWSCHPVYDKASGAMIDYICEKIFKNEMDFCNGLSVRCVLITDPQD